MDPKYVTGGKLPASIGLCADLYAETRQLRLAMEKVVKEVKEREAEVRDHIINNLSKSDDTGAAGKKYRAQIVVKAVPQLNSWEKFTQYVQENGRFDLMQKRLSDKAVTDIWEEGGDVPGVMKFNAVSVSITKI